MDEERSREMAAISIFILSCIHSFIHPFIHSSIHPSIRTPAPFMNLFIFTCSAVRYENAEGGSERKREETSEEEAGEMDDDEEEGEEEKLMEARRKAAVTREAGRQRSPARMAEGLPNDDIDEDEETR